MLITVLAACGSPPQQPATPAPAPPSAVQADLTRVRAALPSGYEVGELTGASSAPAFWGFGAGWSAAPPRCATLADPAPGDRAARGLSASGEGGTVFVVVAADGAGAPPADVLAECSHWRMVFGHTSAEVTGADGPAIEGAETTAWNAVARTVVEAGSQTSTLISMQAAFFGSRVAFVTLITDPGSTQPALDPEFAAGLLATTVAAYRG